MYTDISEIKYKNQMAGRFFFSKDSMRFFKSRILSTIYKGSYFITSEANGFNDDSRSFTVQFASKNGDIDTVGGFNRFKTKQQAVKFIKSLPDFLPDFIEAAKKFWNTDNKQDFSDLIDKHPEYKEILVNNARDWDLHALFEYPLTKLYEISIK